MPNKRLCIPVAPLDDPGAVDFFECCLEPAARRDLGGLQALARLGLVHAAGAARRAWEMLDAPGVQLTPLTQGLNITNSAGAALGLALAPYLAAPRQNCRAYYAMGGLAFAGDDAKVLAAGHLPAKLKAIRGLGRPTAPVLLLFADDGTAEARAEAEALVLAGFRVRLVQTLREARQACLAT